MVVALKNWQTLTNQNSGPGLGPTDISHTRRVRPTSRTGAATQRERGGEGRGTGRESVGPSVRIQVICDL